MTKTKTKTKPGRNKLGHFAKGNKTGVKGNEKRTKKKEARIKTLMLAMDEVDRADTKVIAKEFGVSRETAWNYLNDINGQFQRLLQKKGRKLDMLSLKLMAQLLNRASEGRFAPYQALIGYGILKDKLIQSQPFVEVSTGDKVIKVYYSQWDKAKQAYEEGQRQAHLPSQIEPTPLKTPLKTDDVKNHKPKPKRVGKTEVTTGNPSFVGFDEKPLRRD